MMCFNCEYIIKVFGVAKDVLGVVKDFWLQITDPRMTAPKRYKEVRRLDKCGFTEKEINIMIGGAYRCRNNC